MPKDVKRLLVILACPGDVQREAELLESEIDRVKRNLRSAGASVMLELLYWRTDARPGFHPEGPQALIDRCLKIEDCDILIAVFWKHFGTPVNDAESGTEHEVRRAIATN